MTLAAAEQALRAAEYAYDKAMDAYEAAVMLGSANRADLRSRVDEARACVTRARKALREANAAAVSRPVSFEAMLADPHSQYDRDGEVLAMVLEYQNAPSPTIDATKMRPEPNAPPASTEYLTPQEAGP